MVLEKHQKSEIGNQSSEPTPQSPISAYCLLRPAHSSLPVVPLVGVVPVVILVRGGHVVHLHDLAVLVG